MVRQLNKAIEDVILYIKSSDDYKKCVELKEKMSNNNELCSLIEEIKNVQKKYVRSNFDDNVKLELDELERKINDIPIYVIYMQHLSKVNEMINLVKDELNDYFYKLLNE